MNHAKPFDLSLSAHFVGFRSGPIRPCRWLRVLSGHASKCSSLIPCHAIQSLTQKPPTKRNRAIHRGPSSPGRLRQNNGSIKSFLGVQCVCRRGVGLDLGDEALCPRGEKGQQHQPQENPSSLAHERWSKRKNSGPPELDILIPSVHVASATDRLSFSEGVNSPGASWVHVGICGRKNSNEFLAKTHAFLFVHIILWAAYGIRHCFSFW